MAFTPRDIKLNEADPQIHAIHRLNKNREDAFNSSLKGLGEYKSTLTYDVTQESLANSLGIKTNRGLPFTGWAARMTSNGIKFNALRFNIGCLQVSEPEEQWHTITVVIKGVDDNSDEVIAEGTTTVDGNENAIFGLVVALKDPLTGDAITLDDTALGEEYLIALGASNKNGQGVGIGEWVGSGNSFAGLSYYTTSQGPLKYAGFTTFTGNTELACDYLLIDNVAESIEVLSIETNDSNSNGVLSWAPPKFYGVEGTETSLYNNSLFTGIGGSLKTNSATGVTQNERWVIDSGAAGVAETARLLSIYDNNYNLVRASSLDVEVAESDAGSGETKTLLLIGDSLVSAGAITQTLLDLAGGDSMSIELIGTKGAGANLHEGRGGWSYATYNSDNADNAFWNSSAFDFSYYLSDNSLSTPDYVCINLGTNDIFHRGSDSDAENRFSDYQPHIQSIIDSIHTFDSSIKIALMTVPPGSTQDAFGANYDNSYQAARYHRNIIIWNRELVSAYGDEDSNNIYIVPSGSSYDSVNNCQKSSPAPANARTTVEVARSSNGVHPANEGYQQIGDALWSFVKCTV